MRTTVIDSSRVKLAGDRGDGDYARSMRNRLNFLFQRHLASEQRVNLKAVEGVSCSGLAGCFSVKPPKVENRWGKPLCGAWAKSLRRA